MKKISKKLADEMAADAEELYNQKAAAMIPYPCDIYGKVIDIPEDELEKANGSLMIQHLINRGFTIQSVIPGSIEKKKVFNPRVHKRVIIAPVVQECPFKIGDQFNIEGVGITTEVIEIKGTDIVVKHLNTLSSPVTMGQATVALLLKREAWTRVR